MPLGTRDILMVIRARDVASRVLREVGTNFANTSVQAYEAAQRSFFLGSALTGVGLGIAAIGVSALAFFDDAVDAAMDYRQQAALTLTQVDELGVSLEEIEAIGMRIADKIPVAFEQIQPALYDIFSTMDVTIVEAETLLTELAKAAVAGQVDIQTAVRSTLPVMNAFGLGVEDINRVNDIMFTMVKEGVGTYDELSRVIGLASPAAAIAGQSFETLAGMIAFMTTQGLSASRSATSAARALEAFAHPKVIARMEDLGMTVKDASGNMLPIVDIVRQMADRFANLPGPERVAALNELFKGAGGTAQARRFWEDAILNFGQFQDITNDMINSQGALQGAYDTMFEQPLTQMQEMTNQYQLMKVAIGQQLIPVKLFLADVVLRVLDAWNSLSPGVQRAIVLFLAISAVLLTIVGVMAMFAGAVLMISGVLGMIGLSLGGVITVVGIVIGVFVALAAVGYLIYRNWETIKDAAIEVWNTIWDALKSFYEWFVGEFGEGFLAIWRTIQEEVGNIIDEVIETWDALKSYASTFWDFVGPLWEDTLGRLWDIIQGFVNGIISLWDRFGSDIIVSLRAAWDLIVAIIRYAITIISNFIQLVLNIIQMDWGEAWDNIKAIANAAWDAIWEALIFVWGLILNFFTNFAPNILGAIGQLARTLWNKGFELLSGLWGGVLDVWNAVNGWFMDLHNKIIRAIGNLGSILLNAGKQLIRGFWNGMLDIWHQVTDWIMGIATWVEEHKGPASKDATLLVKNGQLIMQGFSNGLASGWADVVKQLEGYSTELTGGFGSNIDMSARGTTALNNLAVMGTGNSMVIENITIPIYDARDPEAVAKTVRSELEELVAELAMRRTP